jgi:hypothetical protein
MHTTRLWHAYVVAYTLAMGIPFLLFPSALPVIRYAPGDLVWVRVTGMCLIAYAYFNYTLIREPDIPTIRANVVNQAIGTASVGALALTTGSTAISLIAIMILVGFVGMAVSFQREHRAFTPPRPASTFPLTARWNWYVAGYTCFYAIATSVIPHQILPIVGFDDPVFPWPRMAGLLFFVLCIFNVVVGHEKRTGPIILAILAIRIWFIAVLLVLGLAGYPAFVYFSAGIVMVGVVGTILTYRRERQTKGVGPAMAPAR